MLDLSPRTRWWAAATAAAIGNVVFAAVFFAIDYWPMSCLFLLVALAVVVARENERRAFRSGWHAAHEAPQRRVAPQPWDAW